MRLGEKTTVLKFQRNPLRGKYLSVQSLLHSDTCPFDCHTYSIVNLSKFYPVNVLADLDSSCPRTNSA